MLLLEKVERQEEYSRLMEEWKSKQNRVDPAIVSHPQVLQLNQQRILLNQEYNDMRKQLMRNQKEVYLKGSVDVVV